MSTSHQARYEDDDDDDGPAADPQLEGGMPLPIRQVDDGNDDDGNGDDGNADDGNGDDGDGDDDGDEDVNDPAAGEEVGFGQKLVLCTCIFRKLLCELMHDPLVGDKRQCLFLFRSSALRFGTSSL